MEKDLKLSEDYELALSELKERGQIIKTFINNNGESFFKVSIEINGKTHTVENEDLKLAVIQLRNNI